MNACRFCFKPLKKALRDILGRVAGVSQGAERFRIAAFCQAFARFISYQGMMVITRGLNIQQLL